MEHDGTDIVEDVDLKFNSAPQKCKGRESKRQHFVFSLLCHLIVFDLMQAANNILVFDFNKKHKTWKMYLQFG